MVEVQVADEHGLDLSEPNADLGELLRRTIANVDQDELVP